MSSFFRSALGTLSLCFLFSNLSGQSTGKKVIWFKSGKEIVSFQSPDELRQNAISQSGNYALITFNSLPEAETRLSMKNDGIVLKDYVPNNTFYVYFREDIIVDNLSKYDAHSVNPLWNRTKFDPSLNIIPEHAMDGNKVKLLLTYFSIPNDVDLEKYLIEYNTELIEDLTDRHQLSVKVDLAEIEKLGEIPFIYFINFIDPPVFPENYGGRTLHRSNTIAQDFASGTHYDGTGVSVGMHDDGIIGPHIDYEGRLPIQFPTGNGGDHGDHVAGTIMGAGNLDPKMKGMAFGSDLYVYSSSNNNYFNAINHYNNYGVVITSKSYSDGCMEYDYWPYMLDSITYSTTSLIHVFSAGNNGTGTCNNSNIYASITGWGNITGGTKIGKNVIATGNLNNGDALANSSSRGPADDGRIKPDICTKGSSVESTVDENDYDTKSGTSMAAPGISGSIAQLYHAYKDLNSGQNPHSGLIKGLILNTADDIGNPGPDYKHGWGRINLRRAMEVLENNQYIVGSMSSSSSNTHSISVPGGLKELRVMVYWHDYQGSTTASRAIVNNIDMTLTDPSNNTYLPWVLNPAANAATLDSNAVRAVDSLNNMEQVTIESPSQGSYSVTLNPTSIPQGPQTYHVIYEFVYNEVFVTYPNGGEGLVPGESETVRWDAPDNSATFDLDYSTDGGVNWTSIATGVNANLRQFNWNVPNIVNGTAKVRVTRGLISDQSDENFSIIGVPPNLRIEWICPDSMKLAWDTVSSALNYTAYMLGSKYMDSIGISNNNEFVYHNTKPNNEYWLSVSANTSNPSSGRRAIAIQSSTGTFNCVMKKDLTLTTIVSPVTGNYPDCVADSMPLKVYIKNIGLDSMPASIVKCSVYSVGTLNSNVGALAPGDSVLVTFPSDVDLATALNEIECIIHNSSDINPYNDTIKSQILYTTNSVTKLAPWSDAFEDYNNCGTDMDCGQTICNIGGGWLNDPSVLIDDHDWRLNDGITPSGRFGTTGPPRDFNPGLDTGMYVYTEASNGCNFKIANLTSPCLDLTEMSEPRLTWRYHMYGFAMGSLHMDVLTEDGWQLDAKEFRYGNLGDNWWKDSLDLEPYVGQIVSVRFRGITGEDYASDMALDDINFFESDPYFTVEEKTGIGHVKLYPNPGNNIFYIEWFGENLDQADIDVLEITGKRVLNSIEVNKNSKRIELNMSGLERGTYLVRISSGNNTVVKKLIKL